MDDNLLVWWHHQMPLQMRYIGVVAMLSCNPGEDRAAVPRLPLHDSVVFKALVEHIVYIAEDTTHFQIQPMLNPPTPQWCSRVYDTTWRQYAARKAPNNVFVLPFEYIPVNIVKHEGKKKATVVKVFDIVSSQFAFVHIAPSKDDQSMHGHIAASTVFRCMLSEVVSQNNGVSMSGVNPIFWTYVWGNFVSTISPHHCVATCKYLVQKTGDQLPSLRYVTWQMLHALRTLHSNGHYHGMLRLDDFDLTEHYGIYLSDAVISEHVEMAMCNTFNKGSVKWYDCPEVLMGGQERGTDPAEDVWAVGCFAYELIAKKPLFPGKNIVDQLQHTSCAAITDDDNNTTFMQKLRTAKLPPRETCHRPLADRLAELPDDAADFIRSCVSMAHRPTVETLLRHPYVAGLEPTSSPDNPAVAVNAAVLKEIKNMTKRMFSTKDVFEALQKFTKSNQ
eukprot:PhM_4_TR15791/c0_g2_i1/m.43766/K08824/CDKL; cyclin-dependent kinase-like